MIMLDDKLYLCRPARNVACRKTNCYVNGGPCMCTSEKSYGDDGIKIGIVNKGKWLEDSGNIACSVCHTIWLYRRTDFCPNCGADMREVEK